MKKIFLIVLSLVFLSVGVFAANTVTDTGSVGRVVQVSAMDSDFDLVAQTGYIQYATTGGVPIELILFYPGAANDILVIKDTAATGPVVATMKSVDAEPRVLYFRGAKIKPYLDYSECTLTSGAFVTFILAQPK